MMAHVDMYFWVVLVCHNVGRTTKSHNWGVSKMNVKELYISLKLYFKMV